MQYNVPPANANEAKVRAQQLEKKKADIAAMEASVAAQANKVVRHVGDTSVDEEAIEDGKATAAGAIIAQSVQHIDASTLEDLPAEEEGETSSVAERMAAVQLKRLGRRLEENEKQSKRFAHRLKELNKGGQSDMKNQVRHKILLVVVTSLGHA